MATERKVGGLDNTPITEYWQFNPPKADAKSIEKIKVLTKGMEFKGKYLFTFVDEEMDGAQTHLLKLEDGRKVTVKGAGSLNSALAELGTNKSVRIVFQGKGKSKKKGRRPPYLFDVYEIVPDAPATEATEAYEENNTNEDSTDEDFSEEVPF